MPDALATLRFPDGYAEDIVIHHNGPALWPDWMDVAALEARRKAMGAVRFAGIYLGRPVPAGGHMMNPAWIKEGKRPREDFVALVQAWDLAWQDKARSDYVLCVTLGLTHEFDAYILDIWRGRGMGNNALVELWAQEAAKWNPNQIVIENVGGAQGIIIDAQNRHMLPFTMRNPQHTQKGERFEFVCHRAEAGKLYADKTLGWWATMEAELVTFPNARHDDCVDALSWAMDVFKFHTGRVAEPQAYQFSADDTGTMQEWRRRQFFDAPAEYVTSGTTER